MTHQTPLYANRKVILALIGLTLFFLVMTVLYSLILYSENNPSFLLPFIPLIIFSGFFIFLIGAFLLALSLYKTLESRKNHQEE